MCGIAAIFNLDHSQHPVPRPLIERMRDRLTHRGPDDAGLWEGPQGSIAHRRLTVIDPTPAGHQPFVSPDERYILAYNGELYNDHDLRAELASMGITFRTSCDTETLLHALITWGDEAIDKLRGMFAFTFLDTQTNTLTLARDPMGIKPLYHSTIQTDTGRQLAIASEIPALLQNPAVTRTPDPVTLSAYLSSIRTTLGDRTMFASIKTLQPGDWITIQLDQTQDATHRNWWNIARRKPTQGLRQTIEDSIHRHLRTDVPMCALLSGGLDSAITTSLAMKSLGTLNTYCAGARSEGFADDFTFARQMAEHIDANHHEVEITQALFTQRLPEMVNRLGNPMSTPNEVAIFEVASALRAQGHIVTISGEGADELFAGYAPIMQQCAAHVATLTDPDHDPDGGLFHLQANAWISDELKPAVLNQTHLAQADYDEHLRRYYRETFTALHAKAPTDSPLQAHLQFQRRMNLPNLLQRLDTATMLAGVEGRTPFADIEVAIAANALPMDQKYRHDQHNPGTKIALRNAFAHDLPDPIAHRPKASFPLPFQQWLMPFSATLQASPFARQYFTEESITLVASEPNKYWHMAWPMINLSLWGQAWVINDPVEPEQLRHTTASC
ncbi:MAG: asparagine synthase (glutamine-hydrolyzing) [Phycisphaerales bacterium JB052]